VEKQRRDRNRMEKEKIEKLNREQVRDGLLPLPLPKTTPEPDDDSSSDYIDYSMFKDLNAGVAGDQQSGQPRASAEAPALTAGERTPAASALAVGGRTPIALGEATLGRTTPSRGQVGSGALSAGQSVGRRKPQGV